MTKSNIDTKESIGKEMILWMPHDAQYCYTLNAYALQKGLITEPEAVEVKKQLDEYYKIEQPTEKPMNKYMMEVFKIHGFSYAKILWRIINQFPSHNTGPVRNMELIPDHNKIMKETKIDSVGYYKFVNGILKDGYLSKRTEDKRVIYKINFNKLAGICE